MSKLKLRQLWFSAFPVLMATMVASPSACRAAEAAVASHPAEQPKCDGATDDTDAIAQSLRAAANAGEKVLLPLGTCVFKQIIIPDHVALEGAGVGATTLKLEPGLPAGTRKAITLGNDSAIRNLSLDGNKGAQSYGVCGIWGDQIAGAVEEDVEIRNVLGMGDCIQNSSHVTHRRVHVTHTQRPSAGPGNTGNGSGFWSGAYGRFRDRGDIAYLDCVADYNDLGGLEFGTVSVVIRGGAYSHNGLFSDLTESDQRTLVHTRKLGGALGAAGIYSATGSLSPPVASGASISGVHAEFNTESGFDLVLGPRAVVADNVVAHNGTFGMLLRGPSADASGAPWRVADNIAYDNGETRNARWLAGNPKLEVHAGIGLLGALGPGSIDENTLYDDADGRATQKWGIYANTIVEKLGTPCFAGVAFHDNRLSPDDALSANFDIRSGHGPCPTR
jgi:hypothetical protein